jgi:hypothetical protein
MHHLRHELLIDIRQQQVRARQRPVEFVTQHIDELIDCAEE